MSSKKPGKQPPRGATPPGASARGRQGYSVGTAKKKGGPAATSGGGGNRGRLIAVIAAVVVAVGVGIGAVVLLTGGGDDAYAEGLAAAGCTDQTVEEMPDRSHLAEGEPLPKWNSNPPTSGRHNPTPALWGIYDEAIGQDILLHNLEHGGLVVQYGDDVPPETRTAIRDSILADRDFTVLAPDPDLGNKIAYTMWTHLVECTGFDERVIDGLRAKRNQAPAPETPQDPSVNRQAGY